MYIRLSTKRIRKIFFTYSEEFFFYPMTSFQQAVLIPHTHTQKNCTVEETGSRTREDWVRPGALRRHPTGPFPSQAGPTHRKQKLENADVGDG